MAVNRAVREGPAALALARKQASATSPGDRSPPSGQRSFLARRRSAAECQKANRWAHRPVVRDRNHTIGTRRTSTERRSIDGGANCSFDAWSGGLSLQALAPILALWRPLVGPGSPVPKFSGDRRPCSERSAAAARIHSAWLPPNSPLSPAPSSTWIWTPSLSPWKNSTILR